MIRNLSKQSKQLLGQHCYITLILLIIKTLKRSVLRFYTKKTENMVEGVKGLKAKPTLGKKTAQAAKKSMKKNRKTTPWQFLDKIPVNDRKWWVSITTGPVLAPPNLFTFRHNCDTYRTFYVLCHFSLLPQNYCCFHNGKIGDRQFKMVTCRQQIFLSILTPDIGVQTECRFHHTLISRIFRLLQSPNQNLQTKYWMVENWVYLFTITIFVNLSTILRQRKIYTGETLMDQRQCLTNLW